MSVFVSVFFCLSIFLSSFLCFRFLSFCPFVFCLSVFLSIFFLSAVLFLSVIFSLFPYIRHAVTHIDGRYLNSIENHLLVFYLKEWNNGSSHKNCDYLVLRGSREGALIIFFLQLFINTFFKRQQKNYASRLCICIFFS